MPSSFQSFAFARRGLPVRLRWVLLGWIGAEAFTFLLLVRLLGLGPTLALGIATTVLGVVLMRRLGLETMRGLRRTVDGAEAPDGALADGLLSAFGAVLLIVPGFLANAAGLALAAPSARRAVMRRFGTTAAGGREQVRRRAPTDVIDLGPEDWRPVDRH